LVRFEGDATSLDSTFVADFSYEPPRGRPLHEVLDRPPGLEGNVFFRPRHFLAHPETRSVAGSQASSRLVDATRCAGWALADFLRRSGRRYPGRPRHISIPMSASLTPSQIDHFRRLAEDTPGLEGLLRDHDLVPDEATAVAFAWVRAGHAELS